jgi:hypothetical protein
MSRSDARFFLVVFFVEDRCDRAASGRDFFFATEVFDAGLCEVHSAFAGDRDLFPVMNAFGPRPLPAAMSSMERPEATGILTQNRVLPPLARERVAMLDEQPVGALLALPIAHSSENPTALKFLARKGEVQLALAVGLLWLLTIPISAIPNHYGATPVLPLRDGTFEVSVIQRMVLYLNREPFVVGIEGRTLGYGPRLEDAVELQPQVVVKVRRRMLLDDET